MKKTLMLLAAMVAISAHAQNPFAEYGYTPKIATYSNGQFNEFHDLDTIVKIGSVLFNTRSEQIVAFVEKDTLNPEATLQPDIVSRWLSPDPLAAKYPSHSPYVFAIDNPIYWIDPDGQAVKPSTGSARSAIQTKIDLFNSNETLNQIFANASYTLVGTYNDPNGGSSVQGAGVNAFSLSGVSYAQARRILNNDNTGLSTGQKLEALAWVRALSALDVAEVGVYDNSQTTRFNNGQAIVAGQITDNTNITNNSSMKTFLKDMGLATDPRQRDAAIDNLVQSGNSGVPFVSQTAPQGGVAPTITSNSNQTLNISGMYPVDGGNGNVAGEVSNAVQNFGVSRGTVSVTDDKNRTQLNSDMSTTPTPR